MDIKKDGLYNIRDTADLTKWDIRKLQRYAKKVGIKKIDRMYLFYGYQIEKILLSKSGLSDNVTTTTDNDKGESVTEKDENVLDILNKEIENLRNERDYLNEKYNTDTATLKSQLTKDIPHEEKVNEALRLITLEAMEQNVTHRIFTHEEYEDIIGTVASVGFQEKQIEYLKGRIEKQDEMLQEISAQIRERNFIEAKDKGHHKK